MSGSQLSLAGDQKIKLKSAPKQTRKHKSKKVQESLHLGGAVVGRQTRDRKVTGSTPGRGAIKSTRLTQFSIPPG